MNNGTFAGRCLHCNASVSMRLQKRDSLSHPKVWTGLCSNGHKLKLEIITNIEDTEQELSEE